MNEEKMAVVKAAHENPDGSVESENYTAWSVRGQKEVVVKGEYTENRILHPEDFVADDVEYVDTSSGVPVEVGMKINLTEDEQNAMLTIAEAHGVEVLNDNVIDDVVTEDGDIRLLRNWSGKYLEGKRPDHESPIDEDVQSVYDKTSEVLYR